MAGQRPGKRRGPERAAAGARVLAGLVVALALAACGKSPAAGAAAEAPGPWRVRAKAAVPRFWQVLWNGETFLAVGGRNVVASRDGGVWETIATPATGNLIGIAHNGTCHVAVGDQGAIISSRDGRNWTAHPALTTERLYTVLWTGTRFFAFGNNGVILTSPDGAAWTLEPRNYGGHGIHHGVWTGAEFVLSAYSGVVTSADGLRWRLAVRSPSRLFDLAWSGQQFVAVGAADGTLWTSPDAVTWSPQNPGKNCAGIVWGGRQFVAVGAAGAVLSSPDGATWTVGNTGDPTDLYDVAWNGRIFVAVSGVDGTVLSTEPTPWWKKVFNP